MTRLDRALSIADLRDMARRRLPKSVFEFIDGGAEDERTLADNRHALTRHRIVPRVLVDVAHPKLDTPMLGHTWAAPFVVSPMGSCVLGWPEADIAIARAATAHVIAYTLSTMSTTSIERMARAVQGRLWFQLYVLKNPSVNEQLVARAQAAGYEALVVTVDLPVGGKRERDLRNGISIPLRFQGKHLWEGLTHPTWAWQMLRAGLPEFENVRDLMGEEGAGLTIAARVGQSLNASYQWSDLARLRDQWKGKLLVKGVQHPADAARLAEMGVDGVWVSNHGGRQLDGAIAAADSVPAIHAALQGRACLIMDSGVRRGVDALTAKALGANAVGIGRAALFGACAGGEAGAHRAIEILIDELRRAMQLSGVADFSSAQVDLKQTSA
jgi:L-lactate dehydrogenase (cytochrome)/(S)-mandelate dehydrogenase